MNDYLLSFILGIVEGITEFLPVSSTAHLRISEALLGIDLQDGYWKMFSIVIQLGAILCLPIIFKNRIAEFFSSFPRGVRGDRTIFTHPLTLTLIAFACTSVLSLLSLKLIGKHLESLVVMGTSFIAGGIIMWAVDATFGDRPSGDVETITMPQAILVGCCQTLAPVFPGTSRSMATIVAGELGGLSRTTSLEFSFLLSIPTMAAASAFDLLRTLHPSHSAEPAAPIHIGGHEWILLAIGFFVSFIVAWAVVEWFLAWVRKHGFAPFAIYRIILGIGVLVWAYR